MKEPIHCIDVGALDIGCEADPWVRWAQEGCADVLGFKPLQEECDQLNQKANQAGTAIRYLPWAWGDGLEHTLYINNAPMTSSLCASSRATVDLYPTLGALMVVEEQLQVLIF